MSTLINDINIWRRLGRNYHQGVALFSKLSKEAYLVTLFQKNDNDYFHHRLNKEMDKLDGKPNAAVQIIENDPDEEPVRDVLKEVRSWLNKSEDYSYLARGTQDRPGHPSAGSQLYADGVSLFRELSDDIDLVKRLRKYNGDISRMRLRDEMETLYSRLKQTENKQEKAPAPAAVPEPARTIFDELRAWFNEGRNYHHGVAVFGALSDEADLLAFFRNYNSEYTRQRLNDVMQKLYDKWKGKQSDINADPVITDQDHTTVPPKLESKNPELEQACDQKAKQAYQQMMNDRAVLFNLTKVDEWDDANKPDLVEQRRKLALQVCATNYEVSQAYDDLEYVKEHGALPDNEEDETDKDIAEVDLKPAIDNLRKNLSKLRLKEQTPERVTNIQKHQAKLDVLLQKWNAIKNTEVQ